MDISGSTRHTVELSDRRISYQKIGSGPDLLFIHGWPLNGGTWRHVVPHLEGYSRYVIDLPGTGMSTENDESLLGIQAHTESVLQFIDAQGLEDVTLVGQDSGGMVCRYVAEKRPDLISVLCLCGTEIPEVHSLLVSLFSMLAKLPGAKMMFRYNLSNRFLARTPLLLGGTVYDKSLLDGEFRSNLLEPILADDAAMRAMVKMIRDFSYSDVDALADVHAKLNMPVLLVWGEDDPFFPVQDARAMAKQFAGYTEFVAIPKCKLLVQEEYPERFAKSIQGFLERNCQLIMLEQSDVHLEPDYTHRD